mgnify:CR=1 FL=1
MQKIIHRLFKTEHDKLVVFQSPNWTLYLALALWFVSLLVSSQPYNNLLIMFYRLVLMYWASLEIKTGVNLFRNILGTVVFIVILMGFLDQLL